MTSTEPPQRDGAERDGAPPPARALRRRAALVCAGLAVVLLALVALLPAPFAVESPGPVLNTLGTTGGAAAPTSAGGPSPSAGGATASPGAPRSSAPTAGTDRLITITGTRTYPTSGALDLTTVSISGGPDGSVTLLSALRGWLSPTRAALPVAEIFPAGTTAHQAQSQDAAEMDTSQQDATAAALHELGIPVPTVLRVSGTDPGSHAAGVLRAGDVITSVDGRAVPDLPSLVAALRSGAAGRTVVLGVRRSGAVRQVRVRTARGADGSAVLGVYLDPTYAFPFSVKIEVDRIGGPSAGTMFALGIIDELTPGSLTGGRSIAGTGTIDPTGAVGAIGGIDEKMAGAAAAGASAFLAPAADCDEVVGHVPAGLRVVRVATLHQARTAVAALAAGRGASLPTCSR